MHLFRFDRRARAWVCSCGHEVPDRGGDGAAARSMAAHAARAATRSG